MAIFPRKTKFRLDKSNWKMLRVFYDYRLFTTKSSQWVKKWKNTLYLVEILCCLQERRCLKETTIKMCRKTGFGMTTPLYLGHFWFKITCLEYYHGFQHPLYSPDMASNNFYLFLRMLTLTELWVSIHITQTDKIYSTSNVKE